LTAEKNINIAFINQDKLFSAMCYLLLSLYLIPEYHQKILENILIKYCIVFKNLMFSLVIYRKMLNINL